MFKNITKFISSKITFFAITTAFILGLNLTPLIMDIRHAPVGRSFPLIHNNVQDYYFYQALMNEGGQGKWLTSDPFTSEPHKSSIIFAYFVWLGKISKLLGISNGLIYHLTRFIFGILLLLTSYFLLLFLKIPNPRLTYLFFLFAAPFMHIINEYGKFVSVPYMNWWNGIDPIRRTAFLPHHMLGGFLLVLSIILIFKFVNNPKRKYLQWLIPLNVVMAFVNTPSLLIILLILPSTIFIHFLINTLILKTGDAREGLPARAAARQSEGEHGMGELSGRTRKLKYNQIIGLFVYWFIGLLFLFFMVSQTKNGFPWSQYIDWEKNLQFPLEKELLPAMGILLPSSFLGLFSAIKSKKFEYIFIACWLMVPFLFIPIAPKLNLSNIRLIQGIPYLPLAILSVLGIKSIIEFVNTLILKMGDAKEGSQTKMYRSLGYLSGRTHKLIIICVLFIFSIFTYPTLQWSLQDQIREYWPIFGNVYLDNRLFSAFAFINNNYPAKTVTLSTFYTGNYLPSYTHTVSFIGHFGYTYNEKEKEKNVQNFFENKMTEEEAKQFLMNNKITLVFQGPEEKPLYKDYLYPEILKPVYDHEEATIYTLNQ